MYDRNEDAVTISLYDDHVASAGSDELEYAYLCEGCAEEREMNGDVTHLDTLDAGEWVCCEECGCPNRDKNEEDEEDY